MATRWTWRNGRSERPEAPLALRAGPLEMAFLAGDLRSIRLGDHEVVNRIYMALRDRRWRTIPAVITDLVVDAAADSFRITYSARHTEGDIDFAWQAALDGRPDGSVTFGMSGQALAAFAKNRIGLCVLHPILTCAGRRCMVEHSDGTCEAGDFPTLVAPHQPFRDVRAISYGAEAGVEARLEFTGDVFEMEDQRNWTDASFKTYSTPIDLPYPASIARGTQIIQSVRLSLHGATPATARRRRRPPVTLALGQPAGKLPLLGLGMAGHGDRLTARQAGLLRSLQLDHVRVDLDLSSVSYRRALSDAVAQARSLSVRLVIAAHVGSDAATQLAGLAQAADELRPPVAAWLLFDASSGATPAELVNLARARLHVESPAPFGGGSSLYFAELNRNRPPVAALDVVAYPLTPQVHAFDDLSVMENIAGQGPTAQAASAFCGGAPIMVGPITLRMRPGHAWSPAEADARQASLLCAAWMVGSIAQLARHGVRSATYFETTGALGVMGTAGQPPALRAKQAGLSGVYPLYHILADVGDCAGAANISAAISDERCLAALALRSGLRTRLLAANLTPRRQPVIVRGLPDLVGLRMLDEKSAAAAMTAPEAFRGAPAEALRVVAGAAALDLLPYAVARLDWGDKWTGQ